ncbi:hypothetical protein OsJ_12239 [Oryza sativa Japonica Group]|uniref:Uncharacterized protein n=1 Tax=Oryza sativa subsp. japonica TaxID=39947 RepID=B9FAS1_ORYSJ|nr:hypothetical protein OsJ_12239 [Oryza sativa Japonica Group]
MGLVAFLTCLFPYLPEVEALRYLDAAGADALVAARLIVNRRGMEQSFVVDSGATVITAEIALRVEARLAGDLKMLITPNKSRVKALLDNTMMNHATVKDDEILHLKQSWELAESRLDHHNTKTKLAKSWERLAKSLLLRAKPQPVLPHVRAAKKRMLFATIRGFYLQAMARLPADELRARYHRSMLKAGHCYGPLDPVSNIIVNTIWYDQAAFSQSKPCTLQMISTKCLMRIVARSFYGLLSFLCTRYPDCSPDQAMGWLQMANADLRIVDPALGYMSNKITRTDNISMSFCCNLPLQHGDRLCSDDVTLISLLFRKRHFELRHQQQPEPKRLCNDAYIALCHRRFKFWLHHDLVCKNVEVALATFNLDKLKVHKYRLHFICGVNECVSGLEYGPVRSNSPWRIYKYNHSHINFLAICDDPQSANDPATLFFAECSNYSVHEESWCIPVVSPHRDTELVRCIYCESKGTRIVHPGEKSFHGRDTEFEKVMRGERLFPGLQRGSYSNIRLAERTDADWVDNLEEDCIYITACAADNDRRVNPLNYPPMYRERVLPCCEAASDRS